MPNTLDVVLYSFQYLSSLNCSFNFSANYDYTSVFGSSPNWSSQSGDKQNKLVGFAITNNLSVYKNENNIVSTLYSYNTSTYNPNICATFDGVNYRSAFGSDQYNIRIYYGSNYSGVITIPSPGIYPYSDNKIIGNTTSKCFYHANNISYLYIYRFYPQYLSGGWLANSLSVGCDHITLESLDSQSTNSRLFVFKDQYLYLYYELTNSYSYLSTSFNYGDLKSSSFYDSNNKILYINQGQNLFAYYWNLNLFSSVSLLPTNYPFGNCYVHDADVKNINYLHSRQDYDFFVVAPNLASGSIPVIPVLSGNIDSILFQFTNISGLHGFVPTTVDITGLLNSKFSYTSTINGINDIVGNFQFTLSVNHNLKGKVSTFGTIQRIIRLPYIKCFSGGTLFGKLPQIQMSSSKPVTYIVGSVSYKKLRVTKLSGIIVGSLSKNISGQSNNKLKLKSRSFYGEVLT